MLNSFIQTTKTDQTARMWRLIRIFDGRIYLRVRLLMLKLFYFMYCFPINIRVIFRINIDEICILVEIENTSTSVKQVSNSSKVAFGARYSLQRYLKH